MNISIMITEVRSRTTKNTGNGTADPWFIVLEIIEANRIYIDLFICTSIRVDTFDRFRHVCPNPKGSIYLGISGKSVRLWIFLPLKSVRVLDGARSVTGGGCWNLISYWHFYIYLVLWILQISMLPDVPFKSAGALQFHNNENYWNMKRL